MNEFLSSTEVDRRLGLTPPEVKPEEIVIKGRHTKRVGLKNLPENPRSTGKVDSTNSTGKSDSIKSAAKLLEKEHQENREVTNEQLQAANDKIIELKTRVATLEEVSTEVESIKTELDAAKDEIAELKANVEEANNKANNRFEVIETELNEVTEPQEKPKIASLCPNCGKDVGWDSLAVIEGYPDEEGIDFPMTIICHPVKYKRCPECAYYKRINEVMQQLEQKAEEETAGEEAKQGEAEPEPEKPRRKIQDDPYWGPILGIFFK